MKLRSILKVLDKFSYIEIDNELGETIVDSEKVGYETEIEVIEMTELLENFNAELLDKKVVRVYFDYGRFYVEIKE